MTRGRVLRAGRARLRLLRRWRAAGQRRAGVDRRRRRLAPRRPRRHRRHHCRRVGDDQARVAAGVGVFEAEHLVEIRGRVVVAEHRSGLTGRRAQVATCDAQVVRGGQRGVEDVERVLDPVPVAVGAVDQPRRRDELHRTDRAVVHRITVDRAVVGVADDLGAVAVERDTDDGLRRGAVGSQDGAAVSAVVGFDAADPGEQRPRDVAVGVRGVRRVRGVLVGLQRRDRDAVAGQRRGELHVAVRVVEVERLRVAGACRDRGAGRRSDGRRHRRSAVDRGGRRTRGGRLLRDDFGGGRTGRAAHQRTGRRGRRRGDSAHDGDDGDHRRDVERRLVQPRRAHFGQLWDARERGRLAEAHGAARFVR